ncbi:hypothetical protein HYY75_12415 [bacterium]|nr:hypothetical protein [bacterium]
MQKNILSKFPSKLLKIDVVWQPVLFTDNLFFAWVGQRVFSDERLTHYWDYDGSIGKAFKDEGSQTCKTPLMWDAYYLFPPESSWKQFPNYLLGSGRTIIRTWKFLYEELFRALENLGHHLENSLDTG